MAKSIIPCPNCGTCPTCGHRPMGVFIPYTVLYTIPWSIPIYPFVNPWDNTGVNPYPFNSGTWTQTA